MGLPFQFSFFRGYLFLMELSLFLLTFDQLCPWTMDMKVVFLVCPVCDNFEPHLTVFVTVQIQFTLGWSLKQANRGAVVSQILIVFDQGKYLTEQFDSDLEVRV
jgi:hypothetical protein